jgi:hypothetical protein
MVFWNLLDGGPSYSGPLLWPSKSMRGGTPGTNPHHTLHDLHWFPILSRPLLSNSCNNKEGKQLQNSTSMFLC